MAGTHEFMHGGAALVLWDVPCSDTCCWSGVDHEKVLTFTVLTFICLTTRVRIGQVSLTMKISIYVVVCSILLSQVMASKAFVGPANGRRLAGVKTHYVSPEDSDIIQSDGAFPLKGVSSRSPLKEEYPIKKLTISNRQASSRKKWGVDKDYDDEYWFNTKIHTLGNTGFTGGLHAALAPLATKMIDVFAYDGVDIRSVVSFSLCREWH
jgi:hypothetical protein